MDEIFSFDDFLGKVPSKLEQNPVFGKDSLVDNVPLDTISENIDIVDTIDDKIDQEVKVKDEADEMEVGVDIEDFYPLFKDKSENFSCDIYVEGAKTDDTITRLIVESDEWTLMFPGEIKNGKVNIPIRKLSLFEEGQKGKIRLEVIADGSVFIPWEDTFKVKVSKKVTVSLNENKKVVKKPELGVKVNIKR